MLLGGGSILPNIQNYRLCWIAGRPGSYKTSLSMFIAEHYMKQGYRLISNCRTVWADNPKDVQLLDNDQLKAVVILDEGGRDFKAGKQIEEIAAYTRKMDTLFLIPSYWPPTKEAQILTIQARWNLMAIGIPFVAYKWTIKLGSFRDEGNFAFWNPSKVFGIYSTKDPAAEAKAIVNFLVKRKDEYRGRFGYDDVISDLEEVTEIDIFREAVGEMAQAITDLSSVAPRGRKRKGR